MLVEIVEKKIVKKILDCIQAIEDYAEPRVEEEV